MFSIFAIANVIFQMVDKFGPKAKEMFDAWVKDVGENPSPEQWKELVDKIEAATPESYEP